MRSSIPQINHIKIETQTRYKCKLDQVLIKSKPKTRSQFLKP